MYHTIRGNGGVNVLDQAKQERTETCSCSPVQAAEAERVWALSAQYVLMQIS